MRVTLAKGDMTLEIDPCAGGSLSRLKHRDLDVLRPAPDRVGPAFDALQYAAFPMVPFVGRIHNGQFDWNGEQIQLHANLPPEPHAIHGHGWQDVWKVDEQTKTAISLVYRHQSDAWAWDYEARQTFRLGTNALNVELSLRNLDARPMPAGIGWHPYFPREGATLILPTTHKWTPETDTGENVPAAVQIPGDLSRARIVEQLCLDTAYSVRPGPVELSWPTHSVQLKPDPIFSHATVFVPPGKDFFCVEPLTHAPNAINSKLPADVSGARIIAPGASLSGKIKLSVIH